MPSEHVVRGWAFAGQQHYHRVLVVGKMDGTCGDRGDEQRGADPPFVEHLGGGTGFFHLIRIYPAQTVRMVIMGNTTNYDIDAVARLALTRA